MELRYQGFDHQANKRVYRFDGLAKGEPTVQFVVTVDLALFARHHIGIQEGPSLCARKLAANLALSSDREHELTNDDLQAFAQARSDAEARRAESHRNGARHRRAAPAPDVPDVV
jgi:hypothetical protein